MEQINQNFKEMEENILSQVMTVSRNILDAFMFHMVYNTAIDEKKSVNNAILIEEYRERAWKEALKKANGNEDKAYQFYISNVF